MRLTPAIYKYSTLTDGQISGARHVQVDCKATLHGGIRRSLMDVSNLCGLSNTVPNVKPADRFDHFVCSERVLGLLSSNFITRLTDRLTSAVLRDHRRPATGSSERTTSLGATLGSS
jgi:hypothetical protein